MKYSSQLKELSNYK